MTGWSLPALLSGMHQGIELRLSLARALFQHPVMKGDASEAIWLEFLRLYLPMRYQASRAVIVDSQGNFSESIDIVIHDRQFTPFIFQHEGQTIIPAESVYAVFEAKQGLNDRYLTYASQKAESVRALHRTNLPVSHAQGRSDPLPLKPIIAGILTLEGEWSPPLGSILVEKLKALTGDKALDMGCVAATGWFGRLEDGTYGTSVSEMPTTAFLFELIARLQMLGSVPAIDMRAYAAWLK